MPTITCPQRLHTLLSQQRGALGLTRRQVAIACDVTDVTVWRWESGAVQPQLRYVNVIAKTYQLAVGSVRAAMATRGSP